MVLLQQLRIEVKRIIVKRIYINKVAILIHQRIFILSVNNRIRTNLSTINQYKRINIITIDNV